MVVVPLVNVTVPVGFGPAIPSTVATRVTWRFGAVPVVEVPNDVAVGIAWTTWLTVTEELTASLVSPP